MKLKNLLFGAMVACAFAACSDNNDPVTGDPVGPVEADATLSVMVDGVKTKATPADQGIKNLHVIVFNGTSDGATIEAIGSSDVKDGTTVEKIAVKGGNKSVLVLANCSVDAFKVGSTTYSTVMAAKTVFSQQEVDGNLSMNSKVYHITVTSGVENYLGYAIVPEGGQAVIVPSDDNAYNTVKLYRNVAKVVLSGLTVDARGGDGETTYENAALDVQEIFVLHATGTSNLCGDGNAWGTTMVAAGDRTYTGAYVYDGPESVYGKWIALMDGKTELFPYFTAKTTGFQEAYLNYSNKTFDEKYGVGTSFYVYENTNGANMPTLLVVKGTFSYTGVDQEKHEEADRYYTVAIGKTGNVTGEYKLENGETRTDGKDNVLRNLCYKISLTVKGPGYTTPFGPKPDLDPSNPDGTDTHLNVKCEVVKFSDIEQDHEIE